MTLVIAKIFKNSIHIVADSVVTIDIDESNENITEYSSFGESNIHNDKNMVLERVNKIDIINNDILFSFAGSEREGLEHFNTLSNLLFGKNKTEAKEIIENFYLNNIFSDSELVIAYISSTPFLFHINKKKITLYSNDKDIVIIGSGSEDGLLMGQILASLFNIDDRISTFDEYLIFLVAICQSSCINSFSIKNGVGGFFNGAYVKYDSINWADDTAYILYSSNNFNGDKFIIEKFNRDTIVYVKSEEDIKIFYSNYNINFYKTEVELNSYWENELIHLSNNFDFKYIVFICVDYRNVTVLNTKKPGFNQKFNFISKEIIEGKEKIQFKVSNFLMSYLLAKIECPNEDVSNGFAVNINYL
jgi:hypothetical protein